ncbi:MAG: heavy metal sensor histidine kinase [Deltaproteobacteria bacterium]|nr:heavy metal sensor histidine kinase [Deltaproteobacteria bacterium]
MVYAVSTAVLLLLTAGFLYLALERSLDARDHALLASKVQVLRVLLRQESRHTDVLVSEVEHEATESALRYYIRILDGRGRMLIETPGMRDHVPAAVFDDPSPTSAALPQDVAYHARSHGSFLALSIQTPADTGGGLDMRTVQVALDVSADLALLADYRRTLATMLGFGMTFAMVVGGWLARKSTQPLIEITASAQDITASRLDERIVVSRWPAELVDLAAAFNAMLDRLEESFTRLSHFSGELAHALRTPLGNLRGEAEVALARGRTPEEYRQVLLSGIEEYERLSRMVDGLLFIARSDDPNAVVERVRFDAAKEIEDVREFHQPLAAEQGVDVTCEGNGWVTGDRMLFRRAVTNLVANALQHTPAGGSVRICLHPQEGEALEVSVSDTGRGIEPENLPRIFDRFFRTDRSRATVPGGSGLGLAIVRSIMRLHGGNVSARSELERGTTVRLWFPPASAPARAGKMTTL